MSDLDDVREKLVQLWGRLGPFWGISPASARVYAWLLGREGSADGDTIAEGLGMSRGAVSMACRDLVDWGLAHSERVPGSRRTLYSPETDIERAIRGIVQTRKRREWDPILANVSEWNATLRKDRSKEARVLRERLEGIESIVTVVDSLANSFLGDRAIPRLGLKALVASAKKGRSASKG